MLAPLPCFALTCLPPCPFVAFLPLLPFVVLCFASSKYMFLRCLYLFILFAYYIFSCVKIVVNARTAGLSHSHRQPLSTDLTLALWMRSSFSRCSFIVSLYSFSCFSLLCSSYVPGASFVLHSSSSFLVLPPSPCLLSQCSCSGGYAS